MDLEYRYDDWDDDQPEEPRVAEDFEAVDKAIGALAAWRARAEWRNAEADHFNRLARDAVSKALPLGDAEREELRRLKQENAELERKVTYLTNAVTILQTEPRNARG